MYLQSLINYFSGEEEVPTAPHDPNIENIVPFTFEDIYNPDTFNPKQHKDYNPLLDSLIEDIQYNTIIAEKYNDDAYIDENRPGFMNFVRGVESGGGNPITGINSLYGDVTAKNPRSTAKGSYQFTDGTVKTTKKRAINLGFDKDYIKAINLDPTKWTKEQEDVMFLAKMFAEPGTDKSLGKAFAGDKDSWLELYYNVHHTGADFLTKTRAKWAKGLYK